MSDQTINRFNGLEIGVCNAFYDKKGETVKTVWKRFVDDYLPIDSNLGLLKSGCHRHLILHIMCTHTLGAVDGGFYDEPGDDGHIIELDSLPGFAGMFEDAPRPVFDIREQ